MLILSSLTKCTWGILLVLAYTHNNRMQPDFGELALSSAADARRYAQLQNVM